MPFTVAVVPAGQWGVALAIAAARRGCRVQLWLRDATDLASFNAARQVRRLPGVTLPAEMAACSDPATALAGADLVLLAPPSRHLRSLCAALRPVWPSGAVAVSLVKGLEPESHLRMSQVIAAEIPAVANQVAVVSGPNFASEVARQWPAGTVVASRHPAVARVAQDALMTSRLRVYTHHDVVGVELAGAMKNVMAIAAGITDGLGMGHNARATLITRGLAEMARLGEALGAETMTFAGLAGLGDLVLTCTGDLSRNRSLGLAIGRGEAPAADLTAHAETVEGVPTTRAAMQLARDIGVELPITEQVHRILFEGAIPAESLDALMRRERTGELPG